MNSILDGPILRRPRAAAGGIVKEGVAEPGCCVISPLGRRCGAPGKLRYVLCVHEHFTYPNNEAVEICDSCAKFIQTITCTTCKTGKSPHDCKLQIYPAKTNQR